MQKTYHFKLSVKDDNNDACKTANIKISGRPNLAKWALTCYGVSTHEPLLCESSRPYMLAYYLFLYVLLLCIGGEVITVSISFNLMSGRENIMLRTLFIICRKNPQLQLHKLTIYIVLVLSSFRTDGPNFESI
jgi:hypothetical protein